jgi:hypothetical protein
VLLFPLVSQAQVRGACPTLPAGAALSWQVIDGHEYTHCKAVRDGDGNQVFSVTLRPEAGFRARRALRDGDAVVIDGHEVHWHRGEVTGAVVRETVLELGRDSTAHIVISVRDEADLPQVRAQAEGLRFGDVRVGSK